MHLTSPPEHVVRSVTFPRIPAHDDVHNLLIRVATSAADPARQQYHAAKAAGIREPIILARVFPAEDRSAINLPEGDSLGDKILASRMAGEQLVILDYKSRADAIEAFVGTNPGLAKTVKMAKREGGTFPVVIVCRDQVFVDRLDA